MLGPHLIIVPEITISSWRQEFQRWCPYLSVIVLQEVSERSDVVKHILRSRQFEVIVTTYDLIISDTELMQVEWSYLIIDEAHQLKNDHSKLNTIVRQFSSKYRLLITGTLLHNDLHELWSLLNFLMPELFDSSDVFDLFFDDEVESVMIRKLQRVSFITVLFIDRFFVPFYCGG